MRMKNKPKKCAPLTAYIIDKHLFLRQVFKIMQEVNMMIYVANDRPSTVKGIEGAALNLLKGACEQHMVEVLTEAGYVAFIKGGKLITKKDIAVARRIVTK